MTIRWRALLLFGVTESLRDSQWLSLGLTVENGALRLCATVDGKTTAGSGIASFVWPQPLLTARCPICACRGGSPRAASTATCTPSMRPRTTCSPSGPPA